jgi:hypothetical protein
MVGFLADSRYMTCIQDSHALRDVIEHFVDAGFAEFHDDGSVFFFEEKAQKKEKPSGSITTDKLLLCRQLISINPVNFRHFIIKTPIETVICVISAPNSHQLCSQLPAIFLSISSLRTQNSELRTQNSELSTQHFGLQLSTVFNLSTHLTRACGNLLLN